LYSVDGGDKYSISSATGLSGTEYGILVGFGFSLVYVISGLFMGKQADKANRRNIIFYGLIIWNAATCLMGMAGGFTTLLLSRILLGFGQSFSGPASYSMIADYFPVDRRGTANGIYSFGVYVGGGLSSLSIVMAEEEGWRQTCFIVAIVGFAVSIAVILTVKEPPRAASPDSQTAGEDKDEEFTMQESTKALLKNPMVVTIFVAGSVRYEVVLFGFFDDEIKFIIIISQVHGWLHCCWIPPHLLLHRLLLIYHPVLHPKRLCGGCWRSPLLLFGGTHCGQLGAIWSEDRQTVCLCYRLRPPPPLHPHHALDL